MKLKDRPGPWKVCTSSEYPTGLIIMDSNMNEVCSLGTVYVNLDDDEVANLIALLPDIVFVLHSVREILYRNAMKEQPNPKDILRCWEKISVILKETGLKL